ncbi:MAG: KH domain-containing protein, partial [Thermoanaerobaculia bacterium]
QVAPEDLGKVIGRQGRTARALRSLLAARGSRDGERYELEIIET